MAGLEALLGLHGGQKPSDNGLAPTADLELAQLGQSAAVEPADTAQAEGWGRLSESAARASLSSLDALDLISLDELFAAAVMGADATDQKQEAHLSFLLTPVRLLMPALQADPPSTISPALLNEHMIRRSIVHHPTPPFARPTMHIFLA